MCAQMFIPSMVNLTEVEYLAVRQYADDHSLGEKGFSAAIRLIINEWLQLTAPRHAAPPSSTCHCETPQRSKQSGS
ncbi:MAG TPA: hypothetical protein VLA49_15830 [Anaerolineales bacterium]|nr:hypothetical protein [Anaerolineales bacterium]